MLGLLSYTLERINSLQKFYLVELKSIERRSKKGREDNRFAMLVDLYLNMLHALPEEEKLKESFVALKTYMDECIEVKDTFEDDVKRSITFSIKKGEKTKNISPGIDISKSAAEYRQFAEMPQIHSDNVLIMLLVRFEEFISTFISILYSMYPEKYLNQQSVVFSEILNSGVDDVRNNIINREVESIMHDSFESWFKLFENHKMCFQSCQKEMIELREIYSRRNILVHNFGKVNKIYLLNVKNSTYQIGEKLNVDKAYLTKAFDTIKKIIFMVFIEANRLFKNKDISLLDEAFTEAFNEMTEENYEVSRKVYDSLRKIKSQNNQDICMSMINYWISVKELNGIECIKKDIEDFDTSALQGKFVLAQLILLNEYENATRLLDDMISRKEFPPSAVENWPLFKCYRETKEYAELKGKHANLFDSSIVETNSENEKPEISIRSELKELEQ